MLVELLVYRLEARGFEVLIARDGGQAAAMAEGQRPDAIVLDAMMPVMNGEQVLVGALELGANDSLIKPFIPEELISRLNRLLESGR